MYRHDHPKAGQIEKALRTNHVYTVLLEAWRGGQRLEQIDLNGKVLSGGVSATLEPGVRMSMNADVKSDRTFYNALRTDGAEVRPYWRLYLLDGTYFDYPLGGYGVESRNLSYSADNGTISLRAKDYYADVVRARFEKPQTPRGNLLDVVEGFVKGGKPGVEVIRNSSTTTTIRRRVFKRERGDDIKELLKSVGMHGYFDRQRRFVIEDIPSLTGSSAFFVRSGRNLVTADVEETREGVYNVVVVNPSGGRVWKPQTLEDRGAGSLTHVDGPFGRVPRFYSSPFIRTEAQARRAGAALLRRTTGLHSNVSLSALMHPGLDVGDVITVSLPEEAGIPKMVQRHIIETIDYSFTGSPQSITTRSTRPTEAGDEEASA